LGDHFQEEFSQREQPQMDVDYLGWFSLMSTLEESLVENSGSKKVWVMDPILFYV
jgi:hypothetical protein